MRPIDRTEILPLGEYEAVRARFRARVIEEKRRRRFRLGEHMAGLFENRDSALLQIQEMLRTERITSESGIRHEIETYNELVPGEGELSLTLFVEIPERELRERMLVALAGLEESIAVEVDGRPQPGRLGDKHGAREDRTTAVHYLKVALDPEARAALEAGSARVAVVVSHPAHVARAELPRETVLALGEDLREPSGP